MKQKKEVASNTKIAIIFFIFLTFIVGISLVIKVAAIIKKSQFDDSKRFTISIANGKNVEIMSLSPNPKSVAVFKLNDNVRVEDVGRLLEIPVDGFISFKSQDLNQKIDSLFTNTVFNYRNLKTNLTIVDLLRLALFTKNIPESSIIVERMEDTRELEADKIIGRLVIDSLIEKDHQTIQIINATVVSGLGNRLAKLITNMGGNVILVTTEDSPRKKSAITYIDKKTYTVEKLQKVLGYETVKESGNAMSDITIVIGEDKLNTVSF